jgi:hypothetical protein
MFHCAMLRMPANRRGEMTAEPTVDTFTVAALG